MSDIVSVMALVSSLAALSFSIVCWCKIQDAEFLEKVRRLWEDEEDEGGKNDE